MIAAGATPQNIEAELAKLPAEADGPALELDEADEGASVALFLAMETQWRTAGLAGVRSGLDYQQLRPTAELLGVQLTPPMFADIRIMEAETLKVQAEQMRARHG